MRLDKFVCKSTELTKTEAVQRINAGEVSVNEAIATDEASQVHENNRVMLKGVRLKARDFRYILMHKPAGTICSNIDEAYPSVFNYLEVDHSEANKLDVDYLKVDRVSELHIAGRLDADATGLVLITDDGRWSFNITAPANQCSKVYRVGLSKEMSDQVAEQVASLFDKGVQLQGEQQLCLPASLQVISPKEVLLTLTEGKFHQVKRMFTAVGNRVISLHREQIGDIFLDVEVGRWRYLTHDEVQSLAFHCEQ